MTDVPPGSDGAPHLTALPGGHAGDDVAALNGATLLLAPAAAHEPDPAEARYRTLLGNLPDTVVSLYDRDLRCMSIDGQLLAEHGTNPAEFVGRTLRETLSPRDADRMQPYWERALEGTPGSLDYQPEGAGPIFRLDVVPYRSGPGQPVTGVFTVARDVTSQRRADEESIKRARDQAAVAALGVAALEAVQLSDLLDRAVTMVTETLGVDFCEVLELSEGRESMLVRAGLGWRDGLVRSALIPAGSEWYAGFTWGSRGPVVVPDYSAERRFQPTRILREHGVSAGMSVVIGARNRAFGVLAAHSATARRFEPYEADFLHAVANVLAGAYAHEQAEQRIRHQALHDPLTGLPNRTLILERLQHFFERARRSDAKGGLLFVDLDDFKLVNDRFGHDCGDTLLRAVGERLTGVVRGSDTVARVGGDEFLVLCEDLVEDHDALALAERLLDCLEAPFTLAGRQQRVTASVGLAVSPGHHGDADALIRDADAAMYRAKELGGGRCEVFDEVMRDWSRRSREAETDLRRGLDAGEFFNVYQPIVSALDGAILGFEALVRWQHPIHGVVPPAGFIPAAEQSGLIVELGETVLRRACADAVAWHSPSGDPIRVSVNVSPAQLSHAGLVGAVTSALEASGLEAERLSLELTESALIEDADSALRVLSELKALGVHLELDDFGTGYSSLTYARRFPIDALKIDRSFVDGLESSREDSAIVAAVISMGRALGLNVVAEGVETEEQIRQLRIMGCRLAQGYLFSRPVAVDGVAELLSNLNAGEPSQRTWPLRAAR